MGVPMNAPMNYTVGIFRHHADAKQLAAALAEAKIASKIESISGVTHIVFVKRSQGARAVTISKTNGRWPLMAAPRIITNYWAKPIPDRQFDWSAMEDGGNENMCGWGRTEQEAIEDLKRLQAEEADWLEEQAEASR
jgi:hypothetical protein